MMVYVVFGGMLATTWVQIVKAILLMSCTVVLTILVLAAFPLQLRRALCGGFPGYISCERPGGGERLSPARLRFKSPYGPFELLSSDMGVFVWYRGTATHTFKVLHGARRQDGAHLA